MKVAIVGAGGHGQVVADMIRAAGDARLELVAFLDDDPRLAGRSIMGVPVRGGLAAADRASVDGFVVAIGDNERRSAVCRQLEAAGRRLVSIRHPSAIVSADVAIGDGCMISAGAIVLTGSVIGTGTILNTGCTVDHHTRIGDYVHIAPGVHMGGEVAVGDCALVGIGAVVLPRVVLGAGCTVGAGAVVTCNVPEGITVVGTPARPLTGVDRDRLAQSARSGAGEMLRVANGG